MTRRLDRFGRVLLVITVAALAIRVSYVVFAKWNEDMKGDQIFYNAEANRLAQGAGFVVPFDAKHPRNPGKAPAADHPPLTVVVLAPISWVMNNVWYSKAESARGDPHAQRLMLAVLGTLTVVLIGLLGRTVAGDRVGLLAAGIAAVYPNLWVNDGLVMSETVTALTVVATLLLAYRFARAPSVGLALGLGALCGLAALARAEMVLLVPLLALPLTLLARSSAWRSRVAWSGVSVAAAVVVVSPWVIYNLSRFDEPTFLSTNDGLTLLGANCESMYHGHSIGLWQALCIPPVKGDQSVASREYRSRAFDFIRAHKRDVPGVVLARVGRLWSVYRPSDMLFYNTGEGREAWVGRAGLWFFYPLTVLAIVGVVLLWRARRRVWPLLAPAVIVTLVAAATYGQTRFRVPAEPSIVVLASVVLVGAFDLLERRRHRETTTASLSPG